MIRQAHKRGIPFDFKVESKIDEANSKQEEMKISDRFEIDKSSSSSRQSLSEISAIGVAD